MKIIFFILLTATFIQSFAQNSLVKKGNKAYKKGIYVVALNYLQKAEDKGITSTDNKIKIANCYFKLGNYIKSYDYFRKIGENNIQRKDFLIYGQLQQRIGDYEEAAKSYDKADQSIEMISLLKKSVRWAMANQGKQEDIETFLLGIELNGTSLGVRFWENKLVYSASKTNVPFGKPIPLDLYYVSYVKGNAGRPFLLSNKLVYPLREGGIDFTDKGKTIYFSKEEQVGSNEFIFKIYKATFNGSKWKDIKALNINSKHYSCLFPAISKDGKRLVFVSDMPGGKGGYDLWECKKENGKWSEAENMEQFNTIANEITPFFDADNRLWFASKGFPGYGGYDIFYSSKDKVINPGLPVNSSRNDFSFASNPQNTKDAVIISDRIGQGKDYAICAIKLGEKLPVANNNIENETEEEKETIMKEKTKRKKEKSEKNIVSETTTVSQKNNKATDMKTRKKNLLNKYGVHSMSELDRDTRQQFNDELYNPYKYKGNNIYVSTNIRKRKKTNSENTINPLVENVIYKVQIESSIKPLTVIPQIKGYTAERYFFKGLYRYTIGNFYEVKEADELLEIAKKQGYNDAFIAAFDKNTDRRIQAFVIYKK